MQINMKYKNLIVSKKHTQHFLISRFMLKKKGKGWRGGGIFATKPVHLQHV